MNPELLKLVESVERKGEGELTCVALEAAGAGPRSGAWGALRDRGWIQHPTQDAWCFDRRRADILHAAKGTP